MFQPCKLEDSLRGLTSGSKSRESRTKRMRRRYEIIYIRVLTVSQSIGRAASHGHNQVMGRSHPVRHPCGGGGPGGPRLRTFRLRSEEVRA